MSLTNDDLLALSSLFDNKLKPIQQRLTAIEVTLENEMLPRLQNIESCYTSTYKRYQSGITQLDIMQSDIDIIKKVVSEHSTKLSKIS